MKAILKSIIPPIFLTFIKRLIRQDVVWVGDYKDWEEAKKQAKGYDSSNILDKIASSTRLVRDGKAPYERDGFVFDQVEYSWPLLACLLYVATKKKRTLHVLDFGGSLGSTYNQNKKFLDGLKEVSWSVIEQSQFVEMGRSEFSSNKLKFYYSIDECLMERDINLVLLGSVLQYIEKPYALLEELLKKRLAYVLIDRTLIGLKHTLKLQKVPKSIYEATYPCWVFEEDELLGFFALNGYELIESFLALEGRTDSFTSKGYLFKRVLDE